MSSKVYIPTLNKSSISRHTRGGMRGKGIGSVILDGGMGSQSSYSSLDDYLATTNVRGSGLSGLDKIRGKMESLTVMPSKKTKNIKFTL